MSCVSFFTFQAHAHCVAGVFSDSIVIFPNKINYYLNSARSHVADVSRLLFVFLQMYFINLILQIPLKKALQKTFQVLRTYWIHTVLCWSSRHCRHFGGVDFHTRLDRFFQWRCLSWKLVILHPSFPGIPIFWWFLIPTLHQRNTSSVDEILRCLDDLIECKMIGILLREKLWMVRCNKQQNDVLSDTFWE